MAPSRAYVPSRALLRALLRPQPMRCPFVQPLTTPFTRGKRTRAAKQEQPGNLSVDPKQIIQMFKDTTKRLEDGTFDDHITKPGSAPKFGKGDVPVVNWYEQDLDKGTPRRLVSRLSTAEDWKKNTEMMQMIEESWRNPAYDNAELNRRLIDSLIANPNFADLTQDLKDMRKGIRSREELLELGEKQVQNFERENKQFFAALRMATHQAYQDLVNDPAAAAAKTELQEVLDKMPEVEDIDDPEYQAILNKAMVKLNSSPAFQKKMAAMADNDTGVDIEKDMAQLEKQIDEAIREDETKDDEIDDEDAEQQVIDDFAGVEKLLHQMRDVLKSMGGDPKLDAELDAVLKEDPYAKQEGEFEREMDPDELVKELLKMAESKESAIINNKPEERIPNQEEPEEDVPAELQAKVDKIMEDPNLMEKLVFIQKLIEEQSLAKADITSIAHEVAPDPYSNELEPTRTTTLAQRIELARQDPEHTAALSRLRVSLHPPFNISPALKSFNQAIELAYIGANDDIRRILWRSYQKARSLPTFLQNVSDEAWDILYYSQAVTWGSNQNRQAHLRMILKDLKSLGRDGPPTHPSSLVNGGDGTQLET